MQYTIAQGAGYRDRQPRDADGSYVTWFHNSLVHVSDTAMRWVLENVINTKKGGILGVRITSKQLHDADCWC